MDVSWNWLKEYVDVAASKEEVAERLTMSGLNHESTSAVNEDFCIDLEVTSNRPDCLGHLGVAREIAVLFDLPLRIPEANFSTSAEPISKRCKVSIECPELCRRYTARLVSNVKVGPSPAWLVERLATIGIVSVNNVVDVSNYVMMECGQPLHTFDFKKVAGGQIIVREPQPNEALDAINHNTYSLLPGMCVIADAQKPIAIGGIMGGAGTEISDQTKDVLIEAAWFNPSSVRRTARKLNLHSDSSFRFERNTNWEALDWASRRCAELIQKVAGGEILDGVIDINLNQSLRAPFNFRFAQIERVLGISIPRDFVIKTLVGLGVEVRQEQTLSLQVIAPSWRLDLTREIDLIEEVGRIFGYEKVPDQVVVPMTSSHKTSSIRVMERVHRVMHVAGFDEAMCPSLLPDAWANTISPWTDSPPLVSHQPMLGVLEKGSQNVGAVNSLRRTLLPSLLEAKRINEYRSNLEIDLFETAHVYLAQANGLPSEPLMLGLVSGREFASLKGVVESVCRELLPNMSLSFEPSDLELFDVSRSAQIVHDGSIIGHIGQISNGGKKLFGLRQDTVAAELNLSILEPLAMGVRRHRQISEFPAVTRDFNFVVSEDVAWSQIESVVVKSAGPMLEQVSFREIFRDEKKDGIGKKRVLLSIQLRSSDNTLSGSQVESVCQSVIECCQSEFGAVLST